MAEGLLPPPSVPYSSGQLGSQIYMAHTGREVTVYPVFESELRLITVFNVLSAAGFSVGSALFGFAANIWISARFYADPPLEAKIMLHIMAPGILALAALSFLGAVVAIVIRGSTWKTIRQSVRAAPPS